MGQVINTTTQERFFATIEEYLYWEEQAERKHEYYGGEVVAMAGGKLNHNTVCLNITSELRRILKGKSCRPFNSENKVWIPRLSCFYYPDAFVICGEVQLYEGRQDIVENPVLVFEVLSESTEARDRGEKFRQYMSLPSFREYVLVNSDAIWVEVFYKQSASEWQYTVYQELTDEVRLQSIDITLSVAEIYEHIVLEIS
jgi:Uma2 family endonuclease